MSNRLTNGSYSPPVMSVRQDSRVSQLPRAESGTPNSERPVMEKFAEVVKNSPAVTLLVALAAGVTIGWLVKRS